MLIDESGLELFRKEHLSPSALLAAIEKDVHVLYRLPVGVGKSHALDGLLREPETYQRFSLVVYAAATWDVINERSIVRGDEPAPVPHRVLRARPRERCGSLNAAWEDLESRGCAAMAKATICRQCPFHRAEEARCDWPDQLKQLQGVRLIFTTEDQLRLNRNFVPMLRARTGARRVLLILDEGKLIDAKFRIALKRRDLERFSVLLGFQRPARKIPPEVLDAWRENLALILGASGSDDLGGLTPKLPDALHRHATRLQLAGAHHFGEKFRYVGYDLGHFASSEPLSRSWSSTGELYFVAKPYLDCHMIVASAHHTAVYVAHRLGISSIASPYEHHQFRHSRSRIVNLISRLGADCFFARNAPQILGTYAVLIARNIVEGRTTLFVCKKRWKDFCAKQLQERLATWGFNVRFLTGDDEELPKVPQPDVVPFIHYGVLGVNDFAEYESAYCLTSFNANEESLNATCHDGEPEMSRVTLKIRSEPDRLRRVRIENVSASPDHEEMAQLYLRKAEIDPVIQAVGRTRPLTRSREVILFQRQDFTPDLGPHTTVPSLGALRQELGIPAAGEVDQLLEAMQAENLMEQGKTADEVAVRLGISRTSVFNRLRLLKSATFPNRELLRRICTHAAEAEREAAA